MSCSTCYAKFSLIRREKTCDSCQLSYCSKCLINDEKSKKRLCRNCSKTKTAEPSILTGRNISLIDGRHQCGGSKDFKPSSVKTVDDADISVDQDLKNRLNKLKEGRLSGVNGTEGGNIEERLAKLKGEEIDKNADHRHDWLMKPKPKKTQVEEADDLLNEFHDENKISSKLMSPEEEIARRLAKLKGETFVSGVSSSTVNDIDYDQDVNSYLKAYEQRKADEESENSTEKLYSDLLDESKRVETQAIDQETINLIKQRERSSKKGKDSALSDEEIKYDESDDESEIEQVIKQVLIAKDDEDELEDDTKYQIDAINRNETRK